MIALDIIKREDKRRPEYIVWRPVGECTTPDGAPCGPAFVTDRGAKVAASALSEGVEGASDAGTLRLVVRECSDSIEVVAGYYAGHELLPQQLEKIAAKIRKRGDV